jgi:hypothetical protein
MARKKKIPTIRMTVKLTVADEQALKSAAATLERDPNWVLGKLAHLAVGAIDLSVDVRRWLRGDSAWDAGIPGDQQPLCTIENGDPPVVKVERRKTVAQAPPTVEEVISYVNEQLYQFDPVDFHAFYTANGWVQGRAGKPLLDWKAAAKNWQISWQKKDGGATALSDWGANRPPEPEPERMPDEEEADAQTEPLPFEEEEA